MKMRAIKPSDIKAAAKIIELNYASQYRWLDRENITAMFNNYIGKPKYLVAEEKSNMVGFAGYIETWMDYSVYNIFWVNVDPAHQGQGIGRALVTAVIKIIKKKKASLVLLTTNQPRFYRQFGFKTVMKFGKKGYLLMVLKLT